MRFAVIHAYCPTAVFVGEYAINRDICNCNMLLLNFNNITSVKLNI
jgi:hypothetical protein